ncbi:MAG: GerMN domain-containing protein [Lachnospiraceae bacterium]|nr:GerMN domain-containing protein [Lachnospiraceae bacterium]
MKKRNMAALALLAVMLLTACGRAADTAVTTEEFVVPEMSSKEMLVNSLEYLLEEEPEEETGEEQDKAAQTEETDKMTAEPAAEGDGMQEESEEQEKATVICYGKDMGSGLTEEVITAEQITPDVLLGALARHNIVPLLDAKALSMEEREEDGRRILYLDLSGSFREYLMTMSTEAECIIISSIANTFLANYDADAVYITVEGETLVTSHMSYTEALTDYTPGEMMAYLTAADANAKSTSKDVSP